MWSWYNETVNWHLLFSLLICFTFILSLLKAKAKLLWLVFPFSSHCEKPLMGERTKDEVKPCCYWFFLSLLLVVIHRCWSDLWSSWSLLFTTAIVGIRYLSVIFIHHPECCYSLFVSLPLTTSSVVIMLLFTTSSVSILRQWNLFILNNFSTTRTHLFNLLLESV